MVTFRELNSADLFNVMRNEYPTTIGRLPQATRATLETSWGELTKYSAAYNDFVNALVNRIGLTKFASQKEFRNPLAVFKSSETIYGDAVQEIAVGLVDAHVYDAQSDYEDVWRRHVPPVKAAYHRINRENMYPVTVNHVQLQRAFLSGSGVGTLADQFMSAAVNSDNLDEFNAMVNLLAKYGRQGGYYYHKLGTFNNKKDAAMDQVEALRAMAENLAFPNSHYNAGGLPTFAANGEVVVFLTPETKAAMDVQALAAAFNIERAEAPQRFITIPSHQWPRDLADTDMILTVDWFFQVWDTLLTTRSIENPKSLNINHFLHHHSIISQSPFAPAVAFSTKRETILVDVAEPAYTLGSVSAVSVYPRLGDTEGDTTVKRGSVLPLDVEVTYTGDEEPVAALKWEVRGQISPRTRIDKLGNLTVAGDESAEKITVRVYDAFDATKFASMEVTLTGPKVEIGPIGQGIDTDGDGVADLVDTDGDGDFEPKTP